MLPETGGRTPIVHAIHVSVPVSAKEPGVSVAVVAVRSAPAHRAAEELATLFA